MITIERLSAEEFDSLLSIEEGYAPQPEKSIVLVAKSDGEIVGRLMLIAVAHVEGAWIHENHRGGTIFNSLMKEIEVQAKNSGLKTIFAYSQTQEIDDYVQRLDYKKSPLRVFRKEL